MSDGLLYNRDGDYITEWFWWFPFLGMFGLPAVWGFVEAGVFGFLLFGSPMFLMIFMQKFFPI